MMKDKPFRAGAAPLLAGGAVWAVLLVSGLASPAGAQAPGNGLAASYGANSGKPIDIEADALEVDDKKKIATFTGNVSATQGDFNLKAKEIQVAYAPPAAKDGAAKDDAVKEAKASSSPLPGGGGADITQIDAKGKVLITTKDRQTGKEGQTATSDWAVFEVKKQLVTLGGEVVLTQETNTLKGSRLVIDLVSGQSRFENNDTAGGGDGAKGRVKALFTPKAREAKPDKADKPEKPEKPR
ncbi:MULTISPECIES: LptA/OstA family protein [Rhodomicrobium]|uniref:LptA/OstA family protein n=1 Tax=Rhodomicrobium TaxID=1068 RepID=UPI000B4B395A|nr:MULTISPECIES: LptA/OstA family protein [Rhodomicrobium]